MSSLEDRTRDLGPFVPAQDDDMIICRCEEVTKGEIRNMMACLPLMKFVDI